MLEQDVPDMETSISVSKFKNFLAIKRNISKTLDINVSPVFLVGVSELWFMTLCSFVFQFW